METQFAAKEQAQFYNIATRRATVFNHTTASIDVTAPNRSAETNGNTSKASGVPKSYLFYILFNSSYVCQQFGYVLVNSTAQAGHQQMYLDITVPTGGYLYTYVANESNVSASSVYYDDFTIVHTRSTPTLQVLQTSDYYPFGLAMAAQSYQKQSSLDNDYLYNGKEEQDELGLGWLDFDVRMYMPEIGRWGVIDPAADAQLAFSPYHFAYNNPVRFNDPTGLIGEDFRAGLATTVVNQDTGEKYEIDDGFDFQFTVSAKDFARVSETGAIPDDLKPAWNKEFWRQVGLALQESSGDSWFDKLMQFFVYDDAGDAVVTVTDGQYASAALGLALSRLKLGQGSKLVEKLFKYGKKSNLPTPDLNPEQFTKKGGQMIHKETGAIYSKSHTSHGNTGNTGDQWKLWPKGTTDFGKASKTTGTRVTIDGAGSVIGN